MSGNDSEPVHYNNEEDWVIDLKPEFLREEGEW